MATTCLRVQVVLRRQFPKDPVLENPRPRYGDPNASIQAALAKARLNARLNIQSRGLDPAQYMPYLDSAFTDIVSFIPKDAINLDNPTNFDSYFDPTIADRVLYGHVATAAQSVSEPSSFAAAA
jgi:hypothetical protein